MAASRSFLNEKRHGGGGGSDSSRSSPDRRGSFNNDIQRNRLRSNTTTTSRSRTSTYDSASDVILDSASSKQPLQPMPGSGNDEGYVGDIPHDESGLYAMVWIICFLLYVER